MSNPKCDHCGHQWDVKWQDDNYTYEQCYECGDKKRFSKHDDRLGYAEEHSADMVQTWDKRFGILYPESMKELDKVKRKEKIEKDEVDAKLEEAAWEIKRSTLSSKFVH